MERADEDSWETASNISGVSEASTMSKTVYAEGDVLGRFFSCIRHNRSKEVEQMLDSGACTVETRGEGGMTPLMAACQVTIRVSHMHRAFPDFIHFLSQNGHKRVAKALLKRFAEINPRDVTLLPPHNLLGSSNACTADRMKVKLRCMYATIMGIENSQNI